ncbi:Clp protease ClpP [Sporolactobacillus sp. CQH2019]|uniref:head maturation protease, ClpP-related n=1 Tax=Sporolactobacillus sp. CQH2019 TaxID=3023512 RepID=UPI002368E3EF|nr:head maturation protease, ClpP-related [Sporolactobacillus sp. CQH2019]MDD9149252.1 Clp protease ClpP [Sporolactobacillus sp. CQH2019]
MTTKVDIKGVIIPNDFQWVYDWLEMDSTSPNQVHSQLTAANGDDLEVEINSPGGSVFDGSEIYTALKEYPANVVVKIVGMAASAASLIAMAGDKVLMSPTAQMMIHNAAVSADGDYRTMDHASEWLQKTNETARNAYKLKTGMDDAQLKDMMDHETWMTPAEAVQKGFADEVMFQQQEPVQVVAAATPMLPVSVINKIRNKLGPIIKPKPIDERDLLTAELNLLSLRSVSENE